MKNIWLIGTGYMAIEYAKVLKALRLDFFTIGRGENNAAEFNKETGSKVFVGGVEKFLTSNPSMPQCVIVAVGIQELSNVTIQLIKFGVKKILLEKPGVCESKEIDTLVETANKYNAKVLLAYNRRFYSSVIAAEKIIKEDGGVTSFNFEFTEWGHQIEKLNKPKVVFENWFLANSSHVVDIAFFLGGYPKEINSYVSGSLNWHSRASKFAGAGKTDKDALFSYNANWSSPGRWGVELLTAQYRLFLRPMETLQIQKLDSIMLDQFIIDDTLDKLYKPGVFLQTKAFIDNDFSRFCTIQFQQKLINGAYRKISGY